jgi:predicted neuraminidase
MQTYLVASKQERDWQGIPSIARTDDGRLWCVFYSGGPREPDPANSIWLCQSHDDGKSWTSPVCVIDPPGKTRAYDPCLWLDPEGSLWLIYNTANLATNTFGIWYCKAKIKAKEDPVWSLPVQIKLPAAFTIRLNKPIILENEDWLLPVSWSDKLPEEGWFVRDAVQGVAISRDRGQSWSLHGAVSAPAWALENMVAQRKDGVLWMLIRTGAGQIWQSFSSDNGLTWTEGSPSGIVNPGTRFFLGRLAGGQLLLVNTDHPEKRQGLAAWLSTDDASFKKLSDFETRDQVSYPDAVQSADGRIFIVYDRDRYGSGSVHLAVLPPPGS